MMLGYSRVPYARCTDGMDGVNFLNCHKRVFEYLGGIPQEGIQDNCKTVMSGRVGSESQFYLDFLWFALRFGFHPDTCWGWRCREQRRGGASDWLSESDFLYSQPLAEMTQDELNAELGRWLDEVANERTHQTTQERFTDRLAEEKEALGLLPKREIRIFHSTSRRVHKDGLFSFYNN